MNPVTNIFDIAAACLAECDPATKVRRTRLAAAAWRCGRLVMADTTAPAPIGDAGRPARPVLVAPGKVPTRKLSSTEGKAALVHALTHIEFNAINLAWDAVYRFRGLPSSYYGDWIQVADEEAFHFTLLRQRLNALGHDYGDFPAHNGLWAAAQDTADDVLVRMALVPRVLEARGLDVAPDMVRRLRAASDDETAALLHIILRDEVGHVAIGSRWFTWLCAERGLDPHPTYIDLLQRYMAGRIRGPFNIEARHRAGFDDWELAALAAMDTG